MILRATEEDVHFWAVEMLGADVEVWDGPMDADLTVYSPVTGIRTIAAGVRARGRRDQVGGHE